MVSRPNGTAYNAFGWFADFCTQLPNFDADPHNDSALLDLSFVRLARDLNPQPVAELGEPVFRGAPFGPGVVQAGARHTPLLRAIHDNRFLRGADD